MAKKDFSIDALDAFELERPKAAPQPQASEKPPAAPPPRQPENPIPQIPNAPPQEELIRKTYYILPSQHRALKIRAATSDKAEEKDISRIIRNAIDLYLAKP